jgi:hypothetical protein
MVGVRWCDAKEEGGKGGRREYEFVEVRESFGFVIRESLLSFELEVWLSVDLDRWPF